MSEPYRPPYVLDDEGRKVYSNTSHFTLYSCIVCNSTKLGFRGVCQNCIHCQEYLSSQGELWNGRTYEEEVESYKNIPVMTIPLDRKIEAITPYKPTEGEPMASEIDLGMTPRQPLQSQRWTKWDTLAFAFLLLFMFALILIIPSE